MSDLSQPSSHEPVDIDDFQRQLEALFEDAPSGEPAGEPPDGAAEQEPEAEAQGEGQDLGEQPDPAAAAAPEPPAGGQEHPPAEGSEVAPPPSGPQRVRVLDREFDEADAQALVEFYDWVRNNPQQAVAIDSYLRGQARLVPSDYDPAGQAQVPAGPSTPPAEPEPDPLDDLDPAVAEVLRERLSKVDELSERLQTYEQSYEQAQARQWESQVSSAIQRGQETAATKFGLSQDEVQELMGEAAGMNIVAPLLSQRGDPNAAVDEALEIAYWRSPKFREHALTKMALQEAESAKRQRKASALSGGSGSVPRTDKTPSTSTDRRSAMVSEIAQAVNGTQEK
jgi:hypothetical protein